MKCRYCRIVGTKCSFFFLPGKGVEGSQLLRLYCRWPPQPSGFSGLHEVSYSSLCFTAICNLLLSVAEESDCKRQLYVADDKETGRGTGAL